MPKSWCHRKLDLRNIKAIQKRFESKEIKNFPTAASTFKYLIYTYIKGIRRVLLLDYVTYIKKEAMAILEKELGWRPYRRKHGESVFTKFYQNYILSVKFGIDKRKAHYSTLICSGQMTREEALEAMEEELYPQDELRQDKEYVIKKLGFSENEFEEIMRTPPRSHLDYPSDQLFYDAMIKIKRMLTFCK